MKGLYRGVCGTEGILTHPPAPGKGCNWEAPPTGAAPDEGCSQDHDGNIPLSPHSLISHQYLLVPEANRDGANKGTWGIQTLEIDLLGQGGKDRAWSGGRGRYERGGQGDFGSDQLALELPSFALSGGAGEETGETKTLGSDSSGCRRAKLRGH